MVLLAITLIVMGYLLIYTGIKPPDGNPFDVWYWFRHAFETQ